MADEKNINLEQNLMPEKKLNWWQKFVVKFKTFSPSKKGLVLGLIVFGVVILGLLIGFAFARIPIPSPNDPDNVQPVDDLPPSQRIIYFEPANGNMEVNKFYNIYLMLKNEVNDLVAVGADIEYDPQLVDLKVDSSIKTDFPQSGHEKSSSVLSGTLSILRGRQGDGDLNNGIKGKIVKVVGFKIKPKKVVDKPIELKLNNLQIIKDDGNGSPANNFDTRSGSYNIIETAPMIKTVEIKPFTDQGGSWKVDLSWETNIKTESKVFYREKSEGENCASSQLEYISFVKDELIRKYHKIVLPKDDGELKDETNYCLKIEAETEKGRKTVKFTEFNLAGGVEDLSIKNLSAESTYGGRGAVIKWNTTGGKNNGLADTQIKSCTNLANNKLPDKKEEQVLLHQMTLSGLKNNTLYSCIVASTNKADQRATQRIEFTTSEEKDVDANVVLQVRKDRICDEWLYCRSSVQVVNKNDEKENLCFDLGVCQEEDEQGNCIDHVSSNEILNEQVFSNKDDIKNLSGFSKVGFDWGNNKKINGYYHYVNMTPVGSNIYVPNGDFEEETSLLWTAKNAQISIVNDPENKINKVLKIIPKKIDNPVINFLEENLNINSPSWTNVRLPIGNISNTNNYVISLGMKSGGSENKEVNIQLVTQDNNGNDYFATLKKQTIAPYWQTVVVESNHYNSDFSRGFKQGEGYLNFGLKSDLHVNFEDAFYIDNVKIKPALKIAENEYRSTACRMYPSSNAHSCDDLSLSGKQTHGWRGYCVEEDPKYSNMCLNWWPVDILPGEADVFGTSQQAGYTGRQPLYYCLQAQGNYENRTDLWAEGTERYTEFDADASFGEWFETTEEEKTHQAKSSDYKVTFEGLIGALIKNSVNNGNPKYEYSFISSEDRLLRKSEIDSIFFNDNMFVAKLGEEKYNQTVSRTSVFENTYKQSYVSSYWEENPPSGQEIFVVELTEYVENKKSIWDVNSCSSDDFGNFIGLKLIFEKNRLTKYELIECDDDNNSEDILLDLVFTLKEPCNIIAKVTGENGENKAWSSRISKGGWVDENELGYTYDLDYYPYGAAVVPEPANNPEEWIQPLYVMPADDSMGQQKPYQARAGYPYSALGNLGRAECISGSAEKIGTQCDSNQDCGYSLEGEGYGLCVGVNLSEEQSVIVSGNEDYYNGGWKNRLSKLFAKVYGVWKWNEEEGKYEDDNSYEEEEWDVTSDAGLDTAPQVKNIKINQSATSTIQLLGTQKVILEFNSYVDADHLPLTGYKVDWDDGTVNSQISNLKMMPKVNENDPHVLFHAYECLSPELDTDGDGKDETCEFVPKIQIQDNWGWCNGGDYGDCNSWENFAGTIRVTQQ